MSITIDDVMYIILRFRYSAWRSRYRSIMTRGNQRYDGLRSKYVQWRCLPCRFSDLAREKNMKNQKGKNLASSEMEGNKGLSLQERQLRDAAK